MMKKFLKLCNCKKATTIESANYRSSQQNDTRIDDEQIREEEIEQTFAHEQIAGVNISQNSVRLLTE